MTKIRVPDVDCEKTSEIIASSFNNQVAFFNISKKHAFFFCSPDEARYAMDSVREFRRFGNSQNQRKQSRDREVARILDERPWEDQIDPAYNIMSTGGALSMCALNQAFAIIENNMNVNAAQVDILLMSHMRLADVRMWPETYFKPAHAKDIEERGVHGHIMEADVYIDKTVPNDKVIVYSCPASGFGYGVTKTHARIQWEGGMSFVDVSAGF